MRTLTKVEFNLLTWIGSGFLRVWRDGRVYCWLCDGMGVVVLIQASARAVSELVRKKMIERQDALLTAQQRERGMEGYVVTVSGKRSRETATRLVYHLRALRSARRQLISSHLSSVSLLPVLGWSRKAQDRLADDEPIDVAEVTAEGGFDTRKIRPSKLTQRQVRLAIALDGVRSIDDQQKMLRDQMSAAPAPERSEIRFETVRNRKYLVIGKFKFTKKELQDFLGSW